MDMVGKLAAFLLLSNSHHSGPSEAELISLAWRCTAAVYQPSAEAQNLAFKEQHYIKPTADGTIKATTLTLIDHFDSPGKPQVAEQQSQASHELELPLPVLVVAVRGTASTVDAMVNANSRSRDASALFVCQLALS